MEAFNWMYFLFLCLFPGRWVYNWKRGGGGGGGISWRLGCTISIGTVTRDREKMATVGNRRIPSNEPRDNTGTRFGFS